MERLFDVVQDRRGNAISGASVTVRTAAGAVATIFSDNGSTTAANPLTTNDDGEYSFYAPNGLYSTEIVAAGYATENIVRRTLFDPTDQTARAITDYGRVPVREIDTVTYTVTAGNFGEWLDINTAATATVSLPDQTAVASWDGEKGGSVILRQKGAGKLIIAASGSATAIPATSPAGSSQYSVLAAQCVGTPTWSVFGDQE